MSFNDSKLSVCKLPTSTVSYQPPGGRDWGSFPCCLHDPPNPTNYSCNWSLFGNTHTPGWPIRGLKNWWKPGQMLGFFLLPDNKPFPRLESDSEDKASVLCSRGGHEEVQGEERSPRGRLFYSCMLKMFFFGVGAMDHWGSFNIPFCCSVKLPHVSQLN
jgi:hypothetical protein